MVLELEEEKKLTEKDVRIAQFLAKKESEKKDKNVLVINTANSNLLIVLYKGDQIFVKNEESVKKHNERILSLINEILKENKLIIKDIDELGVVVGPGSFTGVRVGIATVKAFRDANKVIAKGINNLEILFETCRDKNIKFVAIEGSLNSYFVGEYINNVFYNYSRNLTEEELKNLVRDERVACYKISEKMKNSSINFVKIDNDFVAIKNVFDRSIDTSLTPIYYQLSQAEKEKLNKLNIEIKVLNCDYIPDIIRIENDNFDKNITGDEPWSEGIVNTLIDNKNLISLAAISGQTLLGYIVGECSDEINISRVAVDKKYQNQGIATNLINSLEKIAIEKVMNLSLEVCEHNISAYKLYLKLGFELRRVRKNYYKDGSSCYEMVKYLV